MGKRNHIETATVRCSCQYASSCIFNDAAKLSNDDWRTVFEAKPDCNTLRTWQFRYGIFDVGAVSEDMPQRAVYHPDDDPTQGWRAKRAAKQDAWELRTTGPVTQRGSLVSARLTDKKASDAILEMMSAVARHKRPDARPADQLTIQEHAAQLCEQYEALFEVTSESDHSVTQDEERHTATVMHMVLPHLASQIREL